MVVRRHVVLRVYLFNACLFCWMDLVYDSVLKPYQSKKVTFNKALALIVSCVFAKFTTKTDIVRYDLLQILSDQRET